MSSPSYFANSCSGAPISVTTPFPRIFWKERAVPTAWIGYGEKKGSPVLFRAQSFSPRTSHEGIWKEFPQEWTCSPKTLISVNWEQAPLSLKLPHLQKRQDSPSFEKWQKVVIDACEKIRKGYFQKVVLVRRTTLSFDAPLNPFEILGCLSSLFAKHATLFMVQLNPSLTFLGATPEFLFSRLDRHVITEAVAGTIVAAETWSPKEINEIEAVQTFLYQTLLPHCEELRWGPFEERCFGKLRHLYQKLEGRLKSGICDPKLISDLHPTPALGGFPQGPALDYLNSVGIDRGWYGAPIGMLSDKQSTLAVAIRSMVVQKNELHLFAGAGIVSGSKPQKEWNELDRKIHHIINVIQ